VLERVQHRRSHAVVGRQPAHQQAAYAVRLKHFVQRPAVVGVPFERRVAVVFCARAFGDDNRAVGQAQVRVERRARCALHAVNLPQAAELFEVARVARVPIARGDHQPATLGNPRRRAVQWRDYLVAFGHCQRAPRTEIVLHIHNQQRSRVHT
jgi:hypothetical protein